MNSSTYPKTFRLLNSRDFNNLKIKPNVKSTKFCKVFYKENDSESSRLGIAVSKKVGNAVVRNKIKRLAREKFRNSELRSLGIDIVYTFSPKLKSSSRKISLNVKSSLNDIEAQILNK